MGTRFSIRRLAFGLGTFVLCGSVSVASQSLNEREARIAVLYNFAKFVEWPADTLPARSPIGLCVIGDAPLGRDLEDAARGREIGGRKIVVSNVSDPAAAHGCHLLYSTGLDDKRIEHLLAATNGTPVLTVSDAPQFAERGGVAGLIFERGRMKFTINVTTAQRAHLAISSRLLALATIIKEAS